MTVDLNRLRAQLPFAREWWAQGEQLRICDAAQAVLDAPTVWYCASAMLGYSQPNSIDCDGTAEHFEDGSYNNHDLCGWVALVPITGEG